MICRRRRTRPAAGLRRHGIRTALVILGALAAMPGCTPLYVPPIPAEIPAPAPADLLGDSALVAEQGTLIATLHLRGVEEPGWLFLQWYAPSLRQVASDAVWIEAGGPTRLVVGVPDQIELAEGRWRLVVGFRGSVLRQFEAVVGTPGLEQPVSPEPEAS